MSSFDLWFSDSEDEDDQMESLRVQRCRIRDSANPLELPDTIFRAYFRLSKSAFTYLLNIIESKSKPPLRSFSVPSVIKLAASLRFFAEGGYQKGVGNDFNVGLAQSTFSIIFNEVLNILENEICSNFIKFPDDIEQGDIKRAFFEKFGFPGIIGCVDGTHVKIISPGRHNQHLFYNRKGFHSLNVMLVCDHNLRIRYVDANNPGSSHDSFIWNQSALDARLSSEAESCRNTWILGDAGYPLKKYLITPFRSNGERGGNSNETRFNEIHSKARNTVERTIGVLKNTFRCILEARELHYKPEKATKIINVCCALHNLRIHHNMEIMDTVEIAESSTNSDVHPEGEEDDADAAIVRRNLMTAILS